MTYVNAVKYINSHRDGTPSPERMRLLCRYLGDPQRQLRFVHIAGGSGKSCCTQMLSVILKESGHKVGALTSPFIKEHREMITVNNEPLTHGEFASYIDAVSSAASKMESDIASAASEDQNEGVQSLAENQIGPKRPKITKNLLEGKISPSPIASEIICAAAFLAFRNNNCNISLLECGDSRADPTGIIDPPLVAVICGSSFTEEQLRTGAGIIRRGTREVVSSAPVGEAYSTIRDACVRTGSRLTVPAHGELNQISNGLSGRAFDYRGKSYSVPYCAEYQLLNALTAIETVYSLRRTGVPLHSEDVAKGISKARIQLRFEIFSVFPAIIIDCPSSKNDCLTFCESLSSIRDSIGESIVLVTPTKDFGINEDLLNQYGFKVTESFTPEKESEDEIVARRAVSLKSNETMLILGPLSFCGRQKNMISKIMAYNIL